MFDLSWSELLLVGAIALVVIGPRELPRVLRTAGQTIAKLRRMAGDFQSQFSAAMREAELDEIRNAVGDVKSAADRAISESGTFDPVRSVRDELRDAIQKPATPKPAPSPAPAESTTAPSTVASSVTAPQPSTTSAAPVIAPARPGDGKQASGKESGAQEASGKAAGKRGRVIVAAPRELVKPLTPPARGTQRLYRKTRFSSLPVRPRPPRDGEGEA